MDLKNKTDFFLDVWLKYSVLSGTKITQIRFLSLIKLGFALLSYSFWQQLP